MNSIFLGRLSRISEASNESEGQGIFNNSSGSGGSYPSLPNTEPSQVDSLPKTEEGGKSAPQNVPKDPKDENKASQASSSSLPPAPNSAGNTPADPLMMKTHIRATGKTQGFIKLQGKPDIVLEIEDGTVTMKRNRLRRGTRDIITPI